MDKWVAQLIDQAIISLPIYTHNLMHQEKRGKMKKREHKFTTDANWSSRVHLQCDKVLHNIALKDQTSCTD